MLFFLKKTKKGLLVAELIGGLSYLCGVKAEAK